MSVIKVPDFLKKEAYIERILDGHSFTEFSENEREKLKQLRITLYYDNKRVNWLALFAFVGLFILAFAKNLMEGYTFENGVIFGFTMFGVIISILPIVRRIENHIENFDRRVLFNEKKILEKYEIVDELPTENTETKEKDNK